MKNKEDLYMRIQNKYIIYKTNVNNADYIEIAMNTSNNNVARVNTRPFGNICLVMLKLTSKYTSPEFQNISSPNYKNS